jgi:hypothetical protein
MVWEWKGPRQAEDRWSSGARAGRYFFFGSAAAVESVGACWRDCFFEALARFCFCRRMARSLSALIVGLT